MNKKIISLLLVLFSTQIVSATGIISVTKRDKGLFGYKVVNWQQGQNSQTGQHGWIGDCHDPGLTACKPPSLSDPIEESAVIELLDYAEKAIDSKIFSGSYQIRIKNEDEAYERVYTVSWNTDNKGDGTIDIDRTDI